jgi:NAD(P)-dependent dehydrogenase (short-subunit alcohol dehydrogenase family)
MKKKCLVFGGGSDIGSEIVQLLDSQGYEVIWTYYSTKREQPGLSIRCDIRAPDCAEVDDVFRGFDGELDAVVTAAFPFLESSSLSFKGYVDAEEFLRGHVYIMTKAAQRLSRGGRIINLLGQSIERGLPGAAFYAASFAFLHTLGQSINGFEGKQGRLAVCDLLLGPVETREWAGLSEEIIQRYRQRVAAFIQPKQVAATVAFLLEQPVMPTTFKLDAYFGN